MDLKNKIVWITGASSGIGEALVYEFIKQGAIVIASSRNIIELERVREKCPKYRCFLQVLDMNQSDNFPDIVQEMIHQHGRIDILVNNAGISQRSKVADTSLEIDRKIMETNFFGTVALTKAVLPYMLIQGGGIITVTSSIAGKFGFPLRSAYSASKHALHGFFESLRLEYHRQGIQINIIIPGRVNTNISVNALEKDGSKHGILDPGQANGISPEKAAKQIIRGIKRNKREINVGAIELLMLFFKRYIPSVHFWISSTISDK